MWKDPSELPTEPGDYCLQTSYWDPETNSGCAGGEQWASFDGKQWLGGMPGLLYNPRPWPLGSYNYEYAGLTYVDNSLPARLARYKESKDALDSTK